MRPVISFITGVVAGIFCIGMIRDCDADESGTVGEDHDHDHDHDHGHEPLIPGADDCYVSPSEFKGFFFAWLHRLSEGVGRVGSTT